MMPDSLVKLIESFKMLPGVGEKSAERYAYAILELDDEMVDMFVESLGDIKKNIKKCEICNSLTDKNICSICSDDNRKNDVLFVVDDPRNVFLFEKLNMFNGKYHVLNGLINPLEGINPEDFLRFIWGLYYALFYFLYLLKRILVYLFFLVHLDVICYWY